MGAARRAAAFLSAAFAMSDDDGIDKQRAEEVIGATSMGVSGFISITDFEVVANSIYP